MRRNYFVAALIFTAISCASLYYPGMPLNPHVWASELPAKVEPRNPLPTSFSFLLVELACREDEAGKQKVQSLTCLGGDGETCEKADENFRVFFQSRVYASAKVDVCLMHGDVRVLERTLPEEGFRCPNPPRYEENKK